MSTQSQKAARRPAKSSGRSVKKVTKSARTSEKKSKSSRARATARTSRAATVGTAKSPRKNGAKMADELHYVPMPKNVVAEVEKTWAAEIKSK